MSKTQNYHFDKYDFIKSFIKDSPEGQRKDKEREAELIADVLLNYQQSNLTTETLQKELIILEHKLIFKLTAVVAALLALVPIVQKFL